MTPHPLQFPQLWDTAGQERFRFVALLMRLAPILTAARGTDQ